MVMACGAGAPVPRRRRLACRSLGENPSAGLITHPRTSTRFMIFREVIVLAATTVMIAPRASSDEPINLRKHLAGSLMQTHD